jgi:hypothetical protein
MVMLKGVGVRRNPLFTVTPVTAQIDLEMPDHSALAPRLAFPPFHNMPGAKNPLSVSNFLEHLHDARAQRRTDSTDETLDVKYMDLTIQVP